MEGLILPVLFGPWSWCSCLFCPTFLFPQAILKGYSVRRSEEICNLHNVLRICLELHLHKNITLREAKTSCTGCSRCKSCWISQVMFFKQNIRCNFQQNFFHVDTKKFFFAHFSVFFSCPFTKHKTLIKIGDTLQKSSSE